MKYFNSLILKLEDIEDDFFIINSRIIEFSNSTDNEYIDFGLINTYLEVLTEYLDFLKQQKKDLSKTIKTKTSKEYISTKKLIYIRIDSIISQIKASINKVGKISKLNKKEIIKKQQEYFKSSQYMEELKKLLKEFNKSLGLYKKVQKDLGIKVNLDDKIEKRLESVESDKSMIQNEKYYIETSLSYLEDILENREGRYNEILSKKYRVFKSIQVHKNYKKIFFNIFETFYNIGLNIYDSKLADDNKKYSNLNNKLDLILDTSIFCEGFDKILKKAQKYGFEEFILPFKESKELLENEVLLKKEFGIVLLYNKLKEIVGIIKLRSIFKYFNNFSLFLDSYRSIGKIDFQNIDKYYNSGFIEFFKEDINGSYLISKLLKEYKLKTVVKLGKLNISPINIIKNKNIFLNEQKYLKKIQKDLISANQKITNYSYSSNKYKNIGFFKADIKKTISNIYSFSVFNDILAYYNRSTTKAYNYKKRAYVASQRRSSSSHYSGSSYSSGSSSWSSSSSSFSSSSSYSSSGSSSW